MSYAPRNGRSFLKNAAARPSPSTAAAQATRARRYQTTRNARFGGATFKGLNRRAVASKETGFIDLNNFVGAYDTTGTIALIGPIAQGASVNQRIGKKAMYKSLQWRGQDVNGAAATYNDICMLIVYDKRPQGALPAITDILVAANSGAMNNDANSGRFRILKRTDYMLVTAPAAANATDTCVREADFFLDLKGLPVVFKAAGTGAIGDIEEGALYVVTVGSTVAGAGAAGSYANARLRFVDN